MLQTWLAFCKWIVERFDKGKGVSIINFLRLSWQHDAIEQEIYGGTARTALKPVWRVAESFERAYGVECKHKTDKRAPTDEEAFEKMEEINFHKIAMRYSNQLSKDVVFSCLRDMFVRIGKAMQTGQHVKIFCGVGDFICRDRKLEFEFDSHYHAYLARTMPSIEGDGAGDEEDQGKSRQSDGMATVSEGGADGDEHQKQTDDMQVSELEDTGACGEITIGSEEDNPMTGAVGMAKLKDGKGVVARQVRQSQDEHMVGQIFNGTGSDETWRLERNAKKGGGPLVANFVQSKLWEKVDKSVAKDCDWLVQNMVLGERRRVELEAKSAEEELAARMKVAHEAPLAKQRVLEAEAAKKKLHRSVVLIGAKEKWVEAEDRHHVAENPFYVHLEPDPAEVIRKKKQLQVETKLVLEQQIAARLQEKAQHATEKLTFEQKQLELADKMLHKTLNQDFEKQQQTRARLKRDWDQQKAFVEKSNNVARLPDVCLVDNRYQYHALVCCVFLGLRSARGQNLGGFARSGVHAPTRPVGLTL